MNQEPDEQAAKHDQEAVLSEASRASVWVSWYFKRGLLTILTVPLFLFLVYAIAVSALGVVVQGYALLRVSGAVFDFVGAFIAMAPPRHLKARENIEVFGRSHLASARGVPHSSHHFFQYYLDRRSRSMCSLCRRCDWLQASGQLSMNIRRSCLVRLSLFH